MKQLGLHTGMGYPQSLEERLALIKENGFDVVGLDFEFGCLKTDGSWEEQLRLAQKYDLPVTDVHLTGYGMSRIWEDGDAGNGLADMVINELRQMSALGVGVGVAHITWGLEPPPPPSEQALRHFYRIADAAEKYNVKLALENSAFAAHVRFVLDHIDSKHIGFCFDSGHENAFTPGERYLDSYGDRLFAMHLHDNDGTFDQHDLPGRGTVDWEDTVRLLKKTELFGKRVMLELGRQNDLTLEEILPLAYTSLKKLAEM